MGKLESRRCLPALASAMVLLAILIVLSLVGCRAHRAAGPISSGGAHHVPVEWQSGGIVHGPATDIHPLQSVAVTASTTLDLAGCLTLAQQKQPRIAAQRATLATAEAGKRAMDKLRFPVTLSSQIPYRREQAGLTIVAASAGLDQVERETTYAVTRTYLTVLLAREQERVARSAVERLNAIKEASEKGLDAGARDVTAADVARSLVYLRLAETRHIQAKQGVERARVALREAIGVGPDMAIDIPGERLPETSARPERAAVVALALSRRGELIQVNVLSRITCLEADAQATSIGQRMQTYAAGIDIHATQVPQGNNGSEYRPAGVPPEMPTLLVGTRPERLKQMHALRAKADAVVTTTRNLIMLEAEDAFLRWEEASQQARKAREAADAGDKLADDLRKDFAGGQKVKVEEVVAARVLASQARAEYNDYHYRLLVALADLERATAGGFSAGLVDSKQE